MWPRSKCRWVPILRMARSLLPSWCTVAESSGAEKQSLGMGGWKGGKTEGKTPPGSSFIGPFFMKAVSQTQSPPLHTILSGIKFQHVNLKGTQSIHTRANAMRWFLWSFVTFIDEEL